MKKKALKITGLVFLSLFVILFFVISFGLGGIIKKAVTTIGPEALGAPVELESVRFARSQAALDDCDWDSASPAKVSSVIV